MPRAGWRATTPLKSTNCEQCQAKPATVPLTRVGIEGLAKLNLCEDCAGALQEVSGSFCLACGMTLAELERTARPGCPACYTVFAEQLAAVIARCQAGSRHQGKVPGLRL